MKCLPIDPSFSIRRLFRKKQTEFHLHSTELGIAVLCECCKLEKTISKYMLLLLFHMKNITYLKSAIRVMS